MTEHDPNAPLVNTTTAVLPGDEATEAAASLWSDAWRVMRGNWLFWVATAMLIFVVLLAAFPQIFTSQLPNTPGFCQLSRSGEPPSSEAWFGYDIQGCDVYTLTVYGARSSVLVGLFTMLATVLLGGFLGVLAGYLGGWVDTLLSRLADVFFAIPLLLGGILFMSAFPNDQNTPYLVVVGKVVIALSILGWPSITRLMRSSVMQVMPNDYVQAARALGASPVRIIRRHIIPNAMAPVLVVSTINLGVFIVAEATLSFLGIGLTPPAVSWGVAISDALTAVRTYPHILFFPALFLSVCVYAFILLGDAARDAFDPKSR